jgi:hypothetical protein
MSRGAVWRVFDRATDACLGVFYSYREFNGWRTGVPSVDPSTSMPGPRAAIVRAARRYL